MANRLSEFFRGDHIATRWLMLLLLAMFYHVAARCSLLLAFPGTSASPVWPPSGIALGAMLLLGYRVWPAIFLGAFSANLAVFAAGALGLGQLSVLASLMIATGNTLEAIAAYWLIRDFSPDNDPLGQPQDIFKFMMAVLLTCMIAASFGTVSLSIAGLLSGGISTTVWLNWWLGDLAGIMVITPLALAWCAQPNIGADRMRWLELLLTAAVLAMLSWLVFGGYFSAGHIDRLLVYLMLPAIVWVAYRYGRRGVTLLTLLFASVAVLATTRGLGPFAGTDLNDALILLVSVIAICALVGLVLAADKLQREGQHAQMQGSLPVSWLTLLAALGITIIVWHLVSLDTEDKARQKFQFQADQLQSTIEQRMAAYVQLLHGGAALFAASVTVERDEWAAFFKELDVQARYPGIQGFGFAQVVRDSEKETFTAATRHQGMSDFAITPPGKRDQYVAITYLEPYDWRNQRAFGYDMLSEPVRRLAIEQARDSGKISVSGKVTLRQETDRDVQAGVLMYLPVYRNGQQPSDLMQRRAAILGYVYAPFRMQDLIRGMLGAELESLDLQILDAAGDADAQLYSSLKPGQAAASSLFRTERTIDFGNRYWRLDIRSRSSFNNSIDRSKAQIILVSGFLVSLLLFMLVRSLALTRQNAEALAGRMMGALQEAEARFRSLAESASEAMIVADAEGSIVSCNGGAYRMFGYDEGELIGKDLIQLMPERFRTAHIQGMSRMNHTGEAHVIGKTVELAGISRDGREFPLELSLGTWQGEHGRFYSAIIRDISARRQAEMNALLVKDRLALAAEAAEAGVMEWDIQADRMTWDERMYQIYQVDPASVEHNYQMWQRCFHPDSANQVEAALQQALASRGRLKTELKIILPDHQVRTIRVRALIVCDEQGQPWRMIGIHLDITEARRAEDELRTSELRFRNTMEHAPIGMAIVSLEGRWSDINEALCKIVGYDRQELRALTFQDITHADDLQADLDQVRQLLAGEIDSYQMQKRYIRKNGEIVWVLLAVSLMRDAQGKPLHFIAQIEDITELKRQEETIRRALAEKETLLREVYHRVKNNLQVVTSLFNLQARTLPEGAARLALQQGAERVYAMALVHEKLYQAENLSTVALDGYIRDLCAHFSQATGFEERDIRFRLQLSPLQADLDTAVPLGLILNELISNSLKHAFAEGKPGIIDISLSQGAEGQVELVVADNGKGMPDNPEKSGASLGMTLVSTLCRQLDAELLRDSGAGTRTTIRFWPAIQESRI